MAKIYFISVGLILVAFGVFLLIRRLWFFFYGIRTMGTLVGWDARGRIVAYHPIVEFAAAKGAVFRITSVAGYSKKVPKTSFCVIYLKSNPKGGLVYSFLHFWAAPIFFIALGSVGVSLLFK